MCSNSFYPKITLPTRFTTNKGTLIDNIFCKLSPSSLNSISGILTGKWSDHQPYFTCLNSLIQKNSLPKFIKLKKEHPEAIEKLRTELAQISFTDKLNIDPMADPTHNLTIFNNILAEAKDKHIPCKLVRFNKHKHKRNPWVSLCIINSIKFRDNQYKKLRNTLSNDPTFTTLKTNLNTYNNILKKSIRNAKKLYYERIFTQFKHDIKKTWSTINDLLNKTRKKKKFPEYFMLNDEKIQDKLQIANQFNIFFTNIGPELATQIHSNTPHTTYMKKSINSTFKFENVHESQILKIIDKLQSKSSCGIDGMSTKLIKILKLEISKPLTLIINQSLNTGIFPDQLKIAKVIPLYKKDDETIFSNYRPISLLPAISELFERVMFNQLYDYFQTHKLFYSSQYGFRAGHSTELAALDLIDRILTEMDKGNIPLCIFLDLSKAFDTLDHHILLNKLNYYGINNVEAKLFKSYLTDRSQYVEFDDTKSDTLPISTGVPQGSILGPLLFIIYMNDIAEITSIFDMIIYADDTTLQSTLNSFTLDLKSNINDKINIEINLINEWLCSNKLSLNINKSKYMIFHQPNKKFKEPQITINNIQIEKVNSFNFLGITIDKQLTWKIHVNKICSKISSAIGILNKLKNYLPLQIKINMYHSMISSHINYGILVWGNNISRIEKLQKKALRTITCSTYTSHTEPLLKSLTLLKASDTHKLAKLKFYHKFLNEQLPTPLQNLPLTTLENQHRHNTRNSQNIHRVRVQHTFAKQSLRYDLPVTINALPPLIKDKLATHSLDGFANYAKSYIISNYSYICEVKNCYSCNRLRV